MALHAKLGKTLHRLLKGKVVLRALWVQGQTGTNTSETPITSSGSSQVENKAWKNEKKFSIILALDFHEHLLMFPELWFQYGCCSEASIQLFLMANIKKRDY